MSDNKEKVITFLQSKYPNSNLEKIEELLYFSVLWNFIESNYPSQFQIEVARQAVWSINQSTDNLSSFNWLLSYFHKRYLNPRYNFDILAKSGNTSNQEHLISKNILSKDANTLSWEEQKEFVAYVISRFRNRLFHWEKELETGQNENFKVINTFLHYLLTK